MSHYTTYDLEESLVREIGKDAVDSVIAAFGDQGDYAEWTGGFLLKLKDGRYCFLQGWCDTTGWGCQDGTSVDYFDAAPDLKDLKSKFSYPENQEITEWDISPADLNIWLKSDRESDSV